MTFRKSVFWVHLAAGLIAGLVILIMSFTGAAIAFQDEIVTAAERGEMQVAPPTPEAARLPLAGLVANAVAAKPRGRPMAVTVYSDPTQSVQVNFGRDGTLCVNPYTGGVREPGAAKWRAFFQTMENWHRFLGRSGSQRALGHAVTSACNAAFLFLALSGLFLWWPRKWRTKGLKRSLWFLRDATGRARDWNWHNVIGFWLAPCLIILTATAVVMSYNWANNLVYQVTGSPVPVPANPAPTLPAPQPGASPLSYDALLAAAQRPFPAWDTLTLRFPNAPRPATEAPAGPPPAVIMVTERDAWPRFARNTLTLDPFTGDLLKRESFADGSLGRRVRTWFRFLHTGEAFGAAGEGLAALASLGACFLVYTGFALSWRRFFMKKEERPAPAPTV